MADPIVVPELKAVFVVDTLNHLFVHSLILVHKIVCTELHCPLLFSPRVHSLFHVIRDRYTLPSNISLIQIE
jgi:hypothetical protein